MNRRQLSLALTAVAFSAPSLRAAPLAAPTLEAVATGSQRTAKNRVRDPWRHPAGTLAFWGLAPGMTVVEIDPSGGYWTEILAPYLRATGGRYIAAVAGDAGPAFKAKYADAATWGVVEVAPFGEHAGVLAAPGSADMVLTARNIHDWMWTPGELDDHLAAFRAALKPAAILAVEEHRADPRPMISDAHDGYVSTAWLEAAVEKAGFRLDGGSEINANPKDDKNHPFGVWTLPPTRRTHAKDQPTPPGFDPAKYEAIGESDRMTLRFRKV